MHGFLHVSQTNFLVTNFTNIVLVLLLKEKREYFALIVLILSTLLISSCSTKSIPEPDTPSKVITQKEPSPLTAEETLALAQSMFTQSTADNDVTLLTQQSNINRLLIEACELFAQQKNYTQALWLANEITQTLLNTNNSDSGKKHLHNSLPTNLNNQQQDYKNTYRILLVKAESLLELNYLQQAKQQLNLANELVAYTNSNDTDNTVSPLTLTYGYYHILYKVLISQGQNTLALDAELNAFALNPHASNEHVFSIWKHLETLTQWQVAQLINTDAPFIKGWAQMLRYSNKFGANPEQLNRYLNLWQQQNPSHPAIAIISQLQSADLIDLPSSNTANAVENIAVLLPLTGNQQKAGLAAQQGILAAYNNNTNQVLTFIDTNQIDWQNMAEQVNTLNITHIIGPLLKTNVETFLTISEQHIELQVPTLLLNLPSEHMLAHYQTALSMRPEDEAIQAAATLSLRNYKNPIILSHNDQVSKRIAIAFREQWQSSTGNTVNIVYFDQGQQMQANLKESLDVNASQARIKQLNSRLKHNIEAEPRNRRDIDMIYLVGTSAQTRLIKPYIDVNISPFADIVPVYASSRSHSNFNDKNNPSSISDLQGLTFTQMPWLLTSQQQDKVLNNLSDKLWPKRTDSLSRIFAMGFDSYHLLDKLALMKKAPYVHHFGQTGTLKLSDTNIITRTLIWGQYKQDKVIQIAME